MDRQEQAGRQGRQLRYSQDENLGRAGDRPALFFAAPRVLPRRIAKIAALPQTIVLRDARSRNRILAVSFRHREDRAMTAILEYFAFMDFLILCGIVALLLCSLYDNYAAK
ncbi:hypothetical protein LXM94_11235 [Rhizobium sp. TRM95111]|uniref:hypothetical protein n=1 Tax=Rhizobium alarense TaxID=2846851 RepID=UPI001F2169D3|nr:hypothetical protein [Rhizobium alarense]MCF3640536.1 hypothetical protein [Rhizobium alarense]